MTQPEAPPAGSERPIPFRGRELWVKLPSPEQMIVWRRTMKMLQGPDVEGWNGEQAMNALERARTIIDSILVNRPDRVWLDDLMLDGDPPLDFREAAGIITATFQAFGNDDTETGKPATKRAAPAKKATRRKASS